MVKEGEKRQVAETSTAAVWREKKKTGVPHSGTRVTAKFRSEMKINVIILDLVIQSLPKTTIYSV